MSWQFWSMLGIGIQPGFLPAPTRRICWPHINQETKMRNWNGFTGNAKGKVSPWREPRAEQAGAATDDDYQNERERLIAKAAYLEAERRGFAPADAMADWLKAEAEVECLLHSRH
jgi:hypothetical protein